MDNPNVVSKTYSTARAFAIGVFALALVTQQVVGEQPARKGGPPPSNLSVTTEIQDVDADGQTCTISSDGQGVYQDGVNGVSSILTANVCNGFTWGDWRFNAAGPRSVTETFLSSDAVQPGDPHYQAPANPPYTGSQLQLPAMNVQCTCAGHADMYTMTAGQTFTCPLLNHWTDAAGSVWNESPMHSFYPGYPDATDAQVTCNAVSTDGQHCVDWFIEPINPARPPGTGDLEAVGRVQGPPSCKKCSGDDGDFYMRFRIHVTLP